MIGGGYSGLPLEYSQISTANLLWYLAANWATENNIYSQPLRNAAPNHAHAIRSQQAHPPDHN